MFKSEGVKAQLAAEAKRRISYKKYGVWFGLTITLLKSKGVSSCVQTQHEEPQI